MPTMSKTEMMVSKIFSARFCMAILLTTTACIGFLKGRLSDEGFMSLAGAVVTAYFLKIPETPKLETKPETKKETNGQPDTK